ncbi:MAG: tyrosine-type recombinase/integrase [Sulfuricurvum sp.]
MRGYSPLTILSYEETLNEMMRKAEFSEEDGVLKINLMPFRISIARSAPKTISRKLSAIRSFIRHLRKMGKEVVLQGDESIKVPKTLPKPVSHQHILEVIEHAQPAEKLMITMLYTLGLRISELANLQLNDIGPQWCRVVGKGNKQRDVPMLPQTYAMMREYHAKYPSEKFVFEAEGEKLSENSLRYIITKAFAKSGLKVTPHQLRHAYATELLNNRARIADVSQLLGHSSMATTQIYTKLGNALKMDHYQQAHPLCQTTGDEE